MSETQHTTDAPRSAPEMALTPQEIVAQLDRYIVGQTQAKRAMAIALRNRHRRSLVSEDMRRDITPKNILMIGPTGVGKTEVARRMARLINAPFIKVEATRFTQVGYVGRDVESIVRDLMDNAITMVQDEKETDVRERAETLAADRLVTALLATMNQRKSKSKADHDDDDDDQSEGTLREVVVRASRTDRRRRKKVAQMLADHQLEEHLVEIEVEDDSAEASFEFIAGGSSDEVSDSFQELLSSLPLRRRRARQVSVREARRLLVQEETNRLIDWDAVVDMATARAENSGVVFIDEIDKIAGRGSETGPDVSGEGVQRDLLPIVEGATVNTRYGPVKTDHVLFVAAGAFSRSRPSDLLPELQGRFPIRVEMNRLSEDDLLSILTAPDNALTRQYQALLETDGVSLEFTPDGLHEIASISHRMNERVEDIGARRLHTIMERVLEEASFAAPTPEPQKVTIDTAYVRAHLGESVRVEDMSRFIL